MEKRLLRLLILEDNPDDAELAVKELERDGFTVEWGRVETEKTFRKALEENPDLILADYAVPSFTGVDALKMQQEIAPEIPLVIISGTIGEEVVVECMKSGATDYVLKDRLLRLGPAAKRAIEEAEVRREHQRTEEALRRSEGRYRVLAQAALDAIITMGQDGRILFWNPAAEKMFGYTTEEAIGKEVAQLTAPCQYREGISRGIKEFSQTGIGTVVNTTMELTGLRKDGTEFPVEVSVAVMRMQAEWQSVAIIRDISERKQAEEQLKYSFINLAETVSRAMESLDPHTASHQRRVAELAWLVGEKMGLDKDRLRELYIGGLLHDIGKASTPLSILTKPGKLTNEEWNLIRTHSRQGYEILKNANLPQPVADMALHHHERLDGSGYPRGIKGDKLSLENRILSACDVVEAMSSHHPYRPARSKDEVLEEINGGRETKYDAKVIDIMLQIIENGEFEFGWRELSIPKPSSR